MTVMCLCGLSVCNAAGAGTRRNLMSVRFRPGADAHNGPFSGRPAVAIQHGQTKAIA